jgi:hypothetical protein
MQSRCTAWPADRAVHGHRRATTRTSADGARKLIYALRVLTASDPSLGSDEAS